MIIELTFKDPDCYCTVDGKDTDGLSTLSKAQQELVGKFVEWSEYVTIRVDTGKGTAEVMPA